MTDHRSPISEHFIRSSGPGGQNVNKVATAVQLRYDLALAPLGDDVKARLRAIAASRITTEGVLVIDARESRSQADNRAAARARLEALIARASRVPRARRATRPSKTSKERRLTQKKHHSAAKQGRGRVRSGDE